MNQDESAQGTGSTHGSSRRAFLLGTGAAALSVPAVRAAAAPTDKPDPADKARGRLPSFAMITDSHINPDSPARSERLSRALAHLEARQPEFILHCGDVTDTGSADEYSLFDSLLSDDVRRRLKVVPGNHEQQWNADALEAYRRLIGPTRTSFDAGALHVVGLDPLVSMESTAHYFGAELLDWFERDLKHAGQGRTIICFLHFPQGGKWHYVMDGDDFLRIASRHHVAAIFVGHIHHLEVDRFNGITQIAGKATRNAACYYWARPVDDAVEVSEVIVGDDGTATQTVVATVPLENGPGAAMGPFRAVAQERDGTAEVTVQLPAHAGADGVRIQPFPQGPNGAGWTECQGSGRRYHGSVDVSALPPGHHRMQVRAVAPDGAFYDDNVPLDIDGGTVRLGWTHRLPGRIRGAIAQHDGVVVVGSVGGAVEALAPTKHAARPRWRARIGAIYKASVFTPDGERVIVPSADHHLYALDAKTGRRAWRVDLGAPVLCDPVLTCGDDPTVAVAAGPTVFRVDLDGAVRWSRRLDGVYVGSMACDGARLFLGSTGGTSYALDLDTGAVRWAVRTATKPGLYGSAAYGPWAAYPVLGPDDTVITASFNEMRALDRDSGATRWVSAPGPSQVIYTPPVLTRQGLLWFDGGKGAAVLSDPATGAQLWTAPLFTTTRDTAPVQVDDSDTYWMVGAPGTVARLDLAARQADALFQISHRFAFSTPAVVPSGKTHLLVSGQQDGRVHGIVGIPE